MKKSFVIYINGRKRRFATLEEAKAFAERIWQKTGVIVGIEAA